MDERISGEVNPGLGRKLDPTLPFFPEHGRHGLDDLRHPETYGLHGRPTQIEQLHGIPLPGHVMACARRFPPAFDPPGPVLVPEQDQASTQVGPISVRTAGKIGEESLVDPKGRLGLPRAVNPTGQL